MPVQRCQPRRALLAFLMPLMIVPDALVVWAVDDTTTSTIRLPSQQFVDITLTSPDQSLGIEIVDGSDGTVRIKRILSEPSQQQQPLQVGMILQDAISAKDVLDRLRKGPYPLSLRFVSDGRTLSLTKQFESLLIVTTQQPQPQQLNQCTTVVSQRGDVLEIMYDAYYVTYDGREVPYDSSFLRGTGQPYQMVLGSGDMIPGVDQGLMAMCIGEHRVLFIPKVLGHGPKSRQRWGIPDDHLGLKWTVELANITR